MATAIAIQHQVGGNLAEILDSIAFTIRERIRIKGEIRTLTAQQRLSGYVVGAPALLPGLLHLPRGAEVLRPDVRQPARRPRHPARASSCSASPSLAMGAGFIFIRKIVDIEV